MSENTLNVRLRSAIKTDAEWQKSNPVLLKGEAVYSSDKKLYKIGDGTSTWSELSYNSADTLAGLVATIDELNYSKGLKGNIQDQLDEISKTEYSDATTDASGLMSAIDKKRIDSVVGAYELGNFSGKTGAELQASLDTWLNTCLGIANASACFYGAQDWMTAWNSGDETKKISAGGRWTVTVIAPYTVNSHVQLRIAYYSDECIAYVHKSGNGWGTAHWAAFKDDLSDKNVLQSSTGTSDYRPLVLGAKYSSDTSKLADTVTDQVYTSTMIYAQSSTGTVFATKFKGALEGNADTATSASTIAITSTEPTTSSAFYPLFSIGRTGNCAARANTGLTYYTIEGTTTTDGYGILRLGNSIAKGVAGNKYGRIDLFSTGSYLAQIAAGALTEHRYFTFPDANGTIALTTSDISGNASTASKWKTARTLTLTGAVTGSVSIDGSGDMSLATTVNHNHNFLALKGTNTIATATDDTTANWASHTNSIHYYNKLEQLKDQPTQYGFLLNVGQNSELHQLWFTQTSGLAHRGGNHAGWSGTWRTILDSVNYSSYALPLAGGTMTGRIQAPSLAGLWTGGMTISNATLGITTQNVYSKYHPIIAGKTTDSHIWNLGTINNLVGFYGFLSGRTENATDWSTVWNVKTGDMTCSGTITAPVFSGTATNLQDFTVSKTTAYDANSLDTNGIVYTSTDLLGQGDGALYQQYYSDKWIHQIFGDYRTGQIALRGKNNGTWQAWRTVLDSVNYKTYCTATNLGFTTASRTSASTATTAGWYRIASSAVSINNSTGVFRLNCYVSGYHTVAYITAGTSYGQNANIQVLQCAHYATNNNPAISKVRIVYTSSYNNNYAYLEVYKPSSSAVTINVSLIEGAGWTLVAPSTVGSIPSGYVNKEVTLTSNAMSAETFVGALSGNATSASTFAVANTNPTTSTLYYLPFITGTSGNNSGRVNNGVRYQTLEGTASANGYGILILGNGTATGTAGNKYGRLDIFGSSAYCISLVSGAPTANRTITFPNATGTVALTSSSITGNAATADKWKTARTLSLTGAVTGSASIDGSGNVSLATTVNHSHTYIESLGNYTFTSSALPNTFSYGLSLGFVNADAGFGSYGTVITARSYTGGGGTLQLYAPYSATYGGTHIKARFGDYDKDSGNSWTTLKEIAWVEDIESYALPLAGGTMTGAISSSLTTSTHIAGNQGKAIINSTAAGSGYNILAKMNSPSGVFCLGQYQGGMKLYYTSNTTITAGTNTFAYQAVLLNESGDSSFPGNVSAKSFTGVLNSYYNRPSSANITATGSGGIISFKASSSMTTGKPPNDAHMLHFFWDNTGGWDSQLALSANTGCIYTRTQNDGTWQSWRTVLDSSNYTTYAAPASGSNNYVRVYNSANVNNNSSLTFNDLAKQHCAVGMIYSSTDNPTGGSRWCHGISMAWSAGSNANWVSQIALGTELNNGMWYRTTQGSIVGAAWKRVLDSSNYSSYALPRSGGTMTGNVVFNNMIDLYWTNMYNVNCSLVSLEGNTMYLGWGGGGNRPSLYIGSSNVYYAEVRSYGNLNLYANNGQGIVFGSGDFRPTASGAYQLGNGSYRWKVLYLSSSPNVSSDRRLKNTILDLEEKYIELCDYLSPKSYYMNDSTDKVRQIGFVAQEVEQAAEKAGLRLNDCGFIHKHYVDREDYHGMEYSLSYDAFGVLAIAKIKQQDKIIDELRSEIEELKSLIT